jgi:hypothetical protein
LVAGAIVEVSAFAVDVTRRCATGRAGRFGFGRFAMARE